MKASRKALPDELKAMGYGLCELYIRGKTVYKMLKDHVLPALSDKGSECHYFEGWYYEQAVVSTFPPDTFETLKRPVAAEVVP